MASPHFDRIVQGLNTSQRTCSFYIAWFGRCYRKGDAGWFAHRTPDDEPVACQDAFFWNAMEIICRELNAQIAVEQSKLMSHAHG